MPSGRWRKQGQCWAAAEKGEHAASRGLPSATGATTTTARMESLGNGPARGLVLEKIVVVALTDSTVLIQSETGRGKELLALTIHRL
jgi:transcriptional regulator with GAF, ATPase, and Fis domain